jgi:hypothetical protein
MAKYRKKPIVIDAIQYNGEITGELHRFLAEENNCSYHFSYENCDQPNETVYLIIHTLEGHMRATPGDWIIKGVNQEFYPCKNDIFEKTYEMVE